MSLFSLIEKLFPTRKVRRKFAPLILGLTSRKQQIKFMCFLKLGRIPNLDNPQRYTEKIFAYRYIYINKLLSVLQDKYLVRKYLQDKGYSDYLIKEYSVADNINNINFDNLPDSFVIKDTLGDYAKEVLIVRDKNKIGIANIVKQVKAWNKKPDSKIIVEQLLPREDNGDFYDYKFFCFDGIVKCLYVVRDGFDGNHELSFYDRDFKPLNAYRKDYAPPISIDLNKPENFGGMIKLAEELGKGYQHVRIDLYNVKGKIYFGEFTFFTGGGFCQFEPDIFDYQLGSYFNLNIDELRKEI